MRVLLIALYGRRKGQTMSARDGSKIPQNPHASIVFFFFKNKDMVLVLCRPLASKAHHQHPQDSEVLSAETEAKI